MSAVFPLGQLVSFGSFNFHSRRSGIVTPTDELQVTYAPIVGRVYPFDRLGNGVASLTTTVRTWAYSIIAQDYSPAAGQELYVVEQQWNLLRDFMVTPYSDGTTQAVQILTVASANQSSPMTRSLTARMVKLEVKEWTWSYMQVEISFAARGEFS